MRCPSGLVWDNGRKLCVEISATCRDNTDNNNARLLDEIKLKQQYFDLEKPYINDNK